MAGPAQEQGDSGLLTCSTRPDLNPAVVFLGFCFGFRNPNEESPENTERRALWRTGLGQLPTGSFYLGTRHSPSLQCRLLRGCT